MATVSPSDARWLQDGHLTAVANDPAIKASWGTTARASQINSVISGGIDAQEEAERELDFLGQPLALEQLTVPGLKYYLLGRTVRLLADRVGYATAPRVLVIGAAEQEDGTTQLQVLRRMAL